MATQLKTASRNGPQTRQTILSVAEQLFAEKGYLGASLSDIVRIVGIAKPSLFHHFPNKESLYVAVLNDIAVSVEPIMQECRDKEDARSALLTLAKDLLEWNFDRPQGARIIMRDMLDIEQRDNPPQKWPLYFVIDTLEKSHYALPSSSAYGQMQFPAFLASYLGAISYLNASSDTLQGMGKMEAGDAATERYGDELISLFSKLL